MVAKREKVKKGESPPIQNERKGDKETKGVVVEQESGENKDVQGEKIVEKDVQDGSVQTKERSNTNEGKKEEGKLDEKTKAEDESKEGDEEEVSKAGESRVRNVIVEDEKARGVEFTFPN